MLLDDRVGVSPGIKFNDAELIGVPTIVVVGRGLVDGVVEVKDRRTGERRDVALTDIVAELRSLSLDHPAPPSSRADRATRRGGLTDEGELGELGRNRCGRSS